MCACLGLQWWQSVSNLPSTEPKELVALDYLSCILCVAPTQCPSTPTCHPSSSHKASGP